MKRNLILVASVLIGTLPFPCSSADRLEDKNTPTSDAKESKSEFVSNASTKERITAPAKATELIGQDVVNLQKEKLGSLSILGVDIEAGRVAVAVIESGGVFGLGSKNIAVPPRALSYDSTRKVLMLDTDQETLKKAPPFEASKWDEVIRENSLLETYRFYHQQPYFGDSEAQKGTTPKAGYIEKSSKVIGLPVMNPANEKCGTVDNLVVDLPTGRIIHVVVSSGGFLGIGDALNAIPPSEFRYTPTRDALILNVTKEELVKAPNFKSTEWPDFKDAQYSGKVYSSYGVAPYFRVDADNTARNVRDRQGSQLTPLDQGSNESDVQTTREIRRTIRNQKGLSVNAHNVKVITVNGRVTLRGPVNDITEKETLEAIAKRIAQNENVESQLEVKQERPKE